mgnify:CR=1 FL=1
MTFQLAIRIIQILNLGFLDRGIVNVIVGFAPVRPAEFVVLELQQKAGELP